MAGSEVTIKLDASEAIGEIERAIGEFTQVAEQIEERFSAIEKRLAAVEQCSTRDEISQAIPSIIASAKKAVFEALNKPPSIKPRS